ncbi:MAG: hypothetical protein HY903_00310 [Deltaproteobacteria bacterium]|nr:hypothetical protein [Deltaproteobacteria bacterium]
MTPTTVQLDLRALPSLPRAYVRGLFARKSGGAPARDTPVIEARLPGLRLDPARVRAYAEVIGSPASDVAPLLYPQVLAMAIHAEMILSPAFPFSPLGLVHRRSTVSSRRPLALDASVDFVCRLAGRREVEHGLELDLDTTVIERGDAVWEATATVLMRKGRPTAKKPRLAAVHGPAAVETGVRLATWELRGDTGRRYAAVSGDYNPIHLWAWSARLLGFRRPIAHGLYTLARALNEARPELPVGPVRIEAAFKRPLLLPATVVAGIKSQHGSVELSVRDAKSGEPHLMAQVKGVNG